jgi:polar amino acid transport system ATP-binding protein
VSAAQTTKAEGAAVTIAHLGKRFSALTALNNVSLSIGPGEVLCLVGPPGAGKSTLLRCIGGSEAIDQGTMEVDGEPIGSVSVRHVIGMVSQQPDMFDHMTALQHIIEGPLALLRRPRREVAVAAMAALERVGLAERRDSYPSELSGGQRQRVAIARALAARPRLILFDEPTAGLDPVAAGEVRDVMRDLAGSGLTMIVATHELGFVSEAADDVAFMAGGEIVERGPPSSILGAPALARTRDFLSTLRI